MRPVLALAASVSLAACQQQEAARPPANESASAANEQVIEATGALLEGQWSVAALDGRPIGAAMSASFAGGAASLVAGCVRRAFTYTQKRNQVSFQPDPGGSSNCEGQGASAQHATASDALQQASIVIFNKDGSEASLSGTGGNLTLRRR